MGEDKSSKKEKKSKKKEKKTEEAEDAPAETGGDDAPEEKAEPKRAQRATSNVFALFNQAQIQEFKEAFTMIDQNRDGIIDLDDLTAIYQQIGREPNPKDLKAMLAECPGDLNFTHFLTLFGEKLHGTDPESALRDAFIMFDPENKGVLHEEYVKDLLMNVGDQFSKDEIKATWKEAPIEGGQLDYMKFVQIIKRGKEED
jgi:Ca2+-binding EF-hand superfamily protein